MVFFGHTKTINLDEGKICKIEMLTANSIITISVFLIGNERFTCIQCTYITICSSLTPPPPIQCWFGLWSARLTSPNIEWGGGG